MWLGQVLDTALVITIENWRTSLMGAVFGHMSE